MAGHILYSWGNISIYATYSTKDAGQSYSKSHITLYMTVHVDRRWCTCICNQVRGISDLYTSYLSQPIIATCVHVQSIARIHKRTHMANFSGALLREALGVSDEGTCSTVAPVITTSSRSCRRSRDKQIAYSMVRHHLILTPKCVYVSCLHDCI